MSNPYELAYLSWHVYDDNINSGTPGSWIPLRTSDDDNLSNLGYFAQAYINIVTEEVVISHRGTDELFGADFDDDILQIAQGQAPEQFGPALLFRQSIIDLMAQQNIDNYTLIHTGHSLGGVIAQLISGSTGETATVFESPGTLEIMQNENISASNANVTI